MEQLRKRKCIKCGKIFTKTGRFCKVCDSCKDKIYDDLYPNRRKNKLKSNGIYGLKRYIKE